MQKQTNLSTLEEIIIEMFDLPKNIKELVLATSLIPDLSLKIGAALPLEKINLLNSLIDTNTI